MEREHQSSHKQNNRQNTELRERNEKQEHQTTLKKRNHINKKKRKIQNSFRCLIVEFSHSLINTPSSHNHSASTMQEKTR